MVCIQNNNRSILNVVSVRKKDSQTLLKTAESWHTLAVKKNLHAERSHTLSQDKKDLAVDLLVTMGCINKQLNGSWKNRKVYTVRDDANAIQGVAIVTFLKTYAMLCCLSTNPHNIVISGKENRVPGVGRSLITQVFHDVMKKKGCMRLQLDTLPTALGFYKKFGFTSQSEESDITVCMSIKRGQIKKVLMQAT